MSIEFKIKDFFYPASILKLRTFLEKSQWFPEGSLREYQMKRIRLILDHAYRNIPYYEGLFDRLTLKPSDIKTLGDFKQIPTLEKDAIKGKSDMFRARNTKKFRPYLCRTSGTSGVPLEFYRDKPSNIMEFCYYWRHWSWAGYRLCMPFAEFSLHHFLDIAPKDISHYSVLYNRLALNHSQISFENIAKFIRAIKRYKPLFLKGAPSTIYIFSILLERKGLSGYSFKAIFTTGEVLFPHQREKIEKVFNCKIFDSYGQMEGVVAICQCEMGRYHISSEYGLMEIEKDDKLSDENTVVGRIIGTSLHNFAMPLIRYRLDDLIEFNAHSESCPCGRGLPVVGRVCGRRQDIVQTKDGRFLTNLFIIPNFIKGISWFQIIQESIDKIVLKIVRDTEFNDEERMKLLRFFRNALGEDTDIDIMYLDSRDMDVSSKYRNVVSYLKPIN